MADPFIALGLNALPPVVNNYHKAWHPIKRQAKKVPIVRRNRQGDFEQDYVYEDMTPEQKGWVLKPRKEVADDEQIMEYVGRKSNVQGNELVPRRPGGAMARRTSSLDRGSKEYRWAKGGYEDSSDEETTARSRRGRSRAGKSDRSHGNTTELRSRSASSTSSLCSSSEDERNCKKLKRKRWITASLATVATIHAAQKVYSSLEARDKRAVEVAKGELSPEDAQKKQNAARWQDAAAIGIAALGIKGAYGEWHEMAEQRAEYKKQLEEREERHRKRVARAQKAKERGVDHRETLHPHDGGKYGERRNGNGNGNGNGQNGQRSKSERRGGDRNYDDRRDGR